MRQIVRGVGNRGGHYRDQLWGRERPVSSNAQDNPIPAAKLTLSNRVSR